MLWNYIYKGESKQLKKETEQKWKHAVSKQIKVKTKL